MSEFDDAKMSGAMSIDEMRRAALSKTGNDQTRISQLAFNDGWMAALEFAQSRLPPPKNPTVDGKDFVELALRTEAPVTEEVLARFQSVQVIRLLHCAIGKVTEAGELIDALKKHLFYGKPIDFTNVIEEFGDDFWYNGIGIDAISKLIGRPLTFQEICEIVINKLRIRYPNKFTEQAAVNRDLVAERKVLENARLHPDEETREVIVSKADMPPESFGDGLVRDSGPTKRKCAKCPHKIHQSNATGLCTSCWVKENPQYPELVPD